MVDCRPKWFCEVCQSSFQRKFALENHYKTLKHKIKVDQQSTPSELDDLRKINNDLTLEVQRLNLEVNKLKEKLSKNVNKPSPIYTRYENCNVTNVQLNLNLNSYGNENWNYLKHDIIEMMRGVNTCIPAIVKRIHFDKDHPENHNIKLPNKRFSEMSTYNGGEWITSHKKDILENLIMNLVGKLEEDYGDDFRNQSTSFIQKLWEEKTNPIISEQKIDKNLRKQVEYSIIDGQNDLKQKK
mgnify:CR=1 FL=1|tara:strand:+ start:4099 stop:4821 length:723 start_codon:yes stop_codon:yes gene_type:complete